MRMAATTCRWSRARSPQSTMLERIREIRRQSKHLVTIGACATHGGIQALRNFADVSEFVAAVYASPEYIQHARDIDADLGSRSGGFRVAAAARSTRRNCSK